MLPTAQLEAVGRQWISEGVPYAFRECPLMFEALREWYSLWLGVHPKEVTVIGSARLGYSLAPVPNFGRAFGAGSDLDLAVVSRSGFDLLAAEFESWIGRYQAGIAIPSDAESRYWPENARTVPANLADGFIDAHKVPGRPDHYPWAAKIAQANFLLRRKLDVTQHAPRVRKVSLRIYRGWQAFSARLGVSLRLLAESLATLDPK